MLTLCISDIHSRFEKFSPKNLPDAETCLIAGDITNLGRDKSSDLNKSSKWMKSMAEKYKEVVYIFGNHDLRMNEYQYVENKNVYCITDKNWGLLNGQKIYGVSLSTCYNLPRLAYIWDHMTSRKEVEEAAFDFGYYDVVLSHSPPYGVLDVAEEMFDPNEDMHLGSKCLSKYIEEKKPKLIVCGHCHKQPEMYAYVNDTLVINVAERWSLIDLEKDKIRIVKDSLNNG